MPRKAKLDGDGEAKVHASERTNGINEAQLKGFVAEAEDEQAKIDEIMRDAVVACQPHVDQIKAIAKAAAEDGGIPKKVFRAKLRERGLKRRADAVRGTLSAEQQDTFDEITVKLGELAASLGPLGKAAYDEHVGGAPH